MLCWKLKGALLLSSALVATTLIAADTRAVTGDRSASELFDPAYVAASACGRAGKSMRNAGPPPLVLAALGGSAAAAAEPESPPLYEGLGDLSWPVTTSSELAQQYFDQGLRLTWAFNHGEARRAFQEAQRQDPDCAMCYWGEAFVLGPNINAPMGDEAGSPALAAIERAQALAASASEREQAVIAALALRYAPDAGEDRSALDGAYADAMAKVHARFPEDPEIAVLTADAMMNTSPWDYWEADGVTAKGRLGEGIAAIEGVLDADPDHPGAIHLYIHLVEASADPHRAEPYADRLGAQMPAAGHIVHMPSHIYYRIGRYIDSLDANVAAVEADEAFFAQVDEADPVYAYGYYPHNIHFVLVSAQMAGEGEKVAWAAERLEGKVPDAVAGEVGWIQAIVQAPHFARAQYASPEEILAQPDPGDTFPFVKAAWHYARGVAQVQAGDLEAARDEAARIAEINQSADFAMLEAWGVPAPDVVRIARHVVEGRIAQAEGDLERAIGEFETAVQIQDTLPYMEPNFWYYPVRQSLAATLLMAGQAEEAERVFMQTLVDTPNNGWALWGLEQARRAQGDEDGAIETAKHFERVWLGDPAMLDLERL
jgi:tetratricopeptide (TPR) repeat protein